MTLTVVLADGHAALRRILRALIDGVPGFEVVADCGDGRETVALASRLQPHIVVIDPWSLRVRPGLDVVDRIGEVGRHIRVVALSMHGDEQHLAAALLSGVCSYVVKPRLGEDLEPALRAAAAGERFVSRSLRAVADGLLPTAAGVAAACRPEAC